MQRPHRFHRLALLAVALAIAVAPADAAAQPADRPRVPLYRWTDEAGNAHITDDPNQIPEARRGTATSPDARPLPPDARPGLPVLPDSRPALPDARPVPTDARGAARAAIESLRAVAALVTGEPDHDAYVQGVAQARAVVDPALGAIERGGLRTALAAALRCYREAAELWENQLIVRRGMNLALNMGPIQGAWECGVQKTAEAERLLGGRGAR